MDDEISPAEVEAALQGEHPPRVVDIRSPAAFERGHIPGSENIPFGDLPDSVESLAESDHIVTVCPHGKASVQAARLIQSYEGTTDARVDSMAGGLDAWEGDLETGSGDERTTADAADNDAADEDAPDAPF